MSENVTLDAFAGERATESADPAAVTSSWVSDGACGACGERVARLWRDGGGRVCAACKTWRTTGEGDCDQ